MRQSGLSVELDQFYLEQYPGGPDEGWPKWCEDRANQSACLLVIPSEGSEWQRDLAVAHTKVGDGLQRQGKLEAAQAAFGADLAISRRLAEQDPSNAVWQCDLALTLIRMARLATAVGRRHKAVGLYREAQRILEKLTALAPEHAGWSEELDRVSAELLVLELGAQSRRSSRKGPRKK